MDLLLRHTDIFLMVVPTPFVAATMASIKDKLRPEQVPPPPTTAPPAELVICLNHPCYVSGGAHLPEHSLSITHPSHVTITCAPPFHSMKLRSQSEFIYFGRQIGVRQDAFGS